MEEGDIGRKEEERINGRKGQERENALGEESRVCVLPPVLPGGLVTPGPEQGPGPRVGRAGAQQLSPPAPEATEALHTGDISMRSITQQRQRILRETFSEKRTRDVSQAVTTGETTSPLAVLSTTNEMIACHALCFGPLNILALEVRRRRARSIASWVRKQKNPVKHDPINNSLLSS